jgi:16S rRNA (cytidine1402-2'-O)-methyltransferase
MSAVLFIVATPIGNLDDISKRALDTLASVDLVAAEDTRHSQRLLGHYGIKARLISLHEHNERERCEQILEQLAQGSSVALISDAGTPLISDPGYVLVNAARDAGFAVTPIPGASSITTALSAAGLPTDCFCFHGFLASKDGERRQRLEQIRDMPGTQVLLESPHRILRLLQQITETTPDATVVLAKELTKRHENFIRGSAQDCLDTLQQDPLLQKGEFVVLLSGPDRTSGARNGLQAVETDRLLGVLLRDLPLKQAVKLATELTGLKRNELYQRALELNSSG